MTTLFKKPLPANATTNLPYVLNAAQAAPVANFTSTLSRLDVTLDASSSTVPSTFSILKYEWIMGDGNTRNGKTVRWSVIRPGTFNVTLKITDSAYRTSSVTKTVTVAATVGDNFDKAANSSSLGTAASGTTSKAWSVIPSGSTFGIQSNVGKPTGGSSTSLAYVNVGSTGGTTQFDVAAVQQDVTRSLLLAFRIVDIQNFWFAQAFWNSTGHQLRIIKKVSNANTTMWSNDFAISVGDRLKITDDGTNVNLYLNDILLTNKAVQDSALNTATSVGFGGSFSSDPVSAVDNFAWWAN